MNIYKMISNLNTELSNTVRPLNGTSDIIKTVNKKIYHDVKDTKASKETMDSKGRNDVKLAKNDSKWNNSWSNVKSTSNDSADLTQKNLQEAIIWSEILGKPMCKRRNNR
ncbi:MAG: hypothetical protein PHF63_03770 [Herbinix sp.]|nr:hypothetical protein [Herbinix sp.]